MAFLGGSSSQGGEEERAFLQRRIALFAKAWFMMSLFGDIMTVATNVNNLEFFEGAALVDRMPTVLMLGIWLFCARGSHSLRLLRATEVFALAVVVVPILLVARGYVAASILEDVTGGETAVPTSAVLSQAVDFSASVMLMFGGCLLFTLRAALIPSPPRWTFLLTAVLGLPFILVPIFFAPVPGLALELRPSPLIEPTHIVGWIFVTVACTVSSQVIYGLRRDIRRARRLGQYTLTGKLGAGGMGEVFKASHAMLRRPTAVKLLPPEKAGQANLERFEREVQLTATLSHPNTVTIYDYGRTPTGVLYYAMELIDGPTLEQVVAIDGPQPPARVAYIMAHVAGALAEAHAAGLIHRDIKPANIMLSERGGIADVVKVLDFGLVKDLEQPDGASLTKVDVIQGTPHYMAPEAIRVAKGATASSDVYALGAVGYFLLTGTTPFDGDSVVEVCGHHLHSDVVPPSQRLGDELPESLEQFVLSCMEKDPEDRPRCTVGLQQELLSLPGVAAWTTADARAWWTAHSEQAWAGHASADVSPLGETIAVDCAERLCG